MIAPGEVVTEADLRRRANIRAFIVVGGTVRATLPRPLLAIALRFAFIRSGPYGSETSTYIELRCMSFAPFGRNYNSAVPFFCLHKSHARPILLFFLFLEVADSCTSSECSSCEDICKRGRDVRPSSWWWSVMKDLSNRPEPESMTSGSCSLIAAPHCPELYQLPAERCVRAQLAAQLHISQTESSQTSVCRGREDHVRVQIYLCTSQQ